MIASDLAAALDPVVFSRRAGIDPDDWQAEVLRSTAPRTLLNISRQSGKSTTAGTLAVHEALYRPGSLVLMVSPGLRQSGELFRKALDVYHALGNAEPARAETLLRLELTNGSRIISLPGNEDTVRGYSAPTLVLIDEASRVPDEMMTAITPMLATVRNYRLLALSTPAGKRGWWWKAWSEGGDLWHRVERKAVDIPRITAEFLEQERRGMPSSWFRQEYECCFEETEDSVFRNDDIQAAFSDHVTPLFGRGAVA